MNQHDFNAMDDGAKLSEIKRRLANVKLGYDVTDLNRVYAQHVSWLIEQFTNCQTALLRGAADLEKLAAFKAWVHKYLDDKGIPTHPDGPHSKEGCRIGDRMDLVFVKIAEMEKVIADLRKELEDTE